MIREALHAAGYHALALTGAGISDVAKMTAFLATLGVALWLYGTGHDVPVGLQAMLFGFAGYYFGRGSMIAESLPVSSAVISEASG